MARSAEELRQKATTARALDYDLLEGTLIEHKALDGSKWKGGEDHEDDQQGHTIYLQYHKRTQNGSESVWRVGWAGWGNRPKG